MKENKNKKKKDGKCLLFFDQKGMLLNIKVELITYTHTQNTEHLIGCSSFTRNLLK